MTLPGDLKQLELVRSAGKETVQQDDRDVRPKKKSEVVTAVGVAQIFWTHMSNF